MRTASLVYKNRNLGTLEYLHFESRFKKKAQNASENVKYDRVKLNYAEINRNRAREMACLEKPSSLMANGSVFQLRFFSIGFVSCYIACMNAENPTRLCFPLIL